MEGFFGFVQIERARNMEASKGEIVPPVTAVAKLQV